MIPTDITFPFLECDIRDAKQVENLYQWVNDIIDVSDISSCIITDYWRGIELFFETDKEIAYLKSIKPPHL
ncbi:hypothetical protein CJ739_240 [Mariniflexile rhizosphaerae]|uniref:hypothetical protein n=2 Tax=Mariniflexile TaxID=527198 RepID=UPI000CA8F7D3|nr:hypothetical protein [Mariniflexile sp. TRM1-10]AXP79340.1 hypothetical protein CJ739_240 [Mariniflexile sp. TRM1-10]PLB20346.1 MAG: hypothetical protein TRG1_694 [Flavobacteriaceae bacterium FS1-H7996/R]